MKQGLEEREKRMNERYCVSWTDDHGDQCVYMDFSPTVSTVVTALVLVGKRVTVEQIKEQSND